MGENAPKNWAETLWALFQEHVPKPLRKSLTFAVAAIVVSFTATKAYFGFQISDTVTSSYFLTASAAAAAGLAIQIRRHVKGHGSYALSFILSAVAIGVSALAWRSWHYSYNPNGAYEERSWKVISAEQGRCMLSWNLIAAKNSDTKITLRVATEPRACPQVTIENLHPVVSGLYVKGAETGEQSATEREFSFEGFKQPARLRFVLTLANLPSSVAPEKCFSSELGISGSSPSQESGEEKKE